MRYIFLTEAEKLPCQEASLTLGTRCLMISKRPITPYAPGSKQRGTPGEETEQTPGEETAGFGLQSSSGAYN